MKTNLSKRMSVVTGLVIFFGVFNILYTLAEAKSWIDHGRWDEEWYLWKVLILSGCILFGIAINVLAMVFMLHSVKLIKRGEFFSKFNAYTLWWSAPICFLYNLSIANLPIINGFPRIILKADTFLFPLLLIGVAMIYSAGVRLSEENSLTV